MKMAGGEGGATNEEIRASWRNNNRLWLYRTSLALLVGTCVIGMIADAYNENKDATSKEQKGAAAMKIMQQASGGQGKDVSANGYMSGDRLYMILPHENHTDTVITGPGEGHMKSEDVMDIEWEIVDLKQSKDCTLKL